jgi:hypothetical protein
VVIFTNRPLYTRERDTDTCWIGSWVGPRAGPVAAVKRKIVIPCRDSNPQLIIDIILEEEYKL